MCWISKKYSWKHFGDVVALIKKFLFCQQKCECKDVMQMSNSISRSIAKIILNLRDKD